jgi:hypothetical protein
MAEDRDFSSRGKSGHRPHLEQIRLAFQAHLAGDGGYRVIPDSEVALALRKEGKVLAGNDEKIFVFTDELVANWLGSAYGYLSPETRSDLTAALMKELLHA